MVLGMDLEGFSPKKVNSVGSFLTICTMDWVQFIIGQAKEKESFRQCSRWVNNTKNDFFSSQLKNSIFIKRNKIL
jgi:hypothetical protein